MLMLTVRHGLAHKQYGRSLKALFKYFDDHGYTKEYFQTFIQVCHGVSVGVHHFKLNSSLFQSHLVMIFGECEGGDGVWQCTF